MRLTLWACSGLADDSAAGVQNGGRSMNLTPLVMEALGKRIDDPAAIRLANAIGRKPFKNATPNTRCDLGDRKGQGIEVVANMILYNRDYWPPRKEGRRWVTWVTNVFLYRNYAGALPDGFDWSMDDAALSAKFERRVLANIEEVRFTLPAPRQGLMATATLGDDGRPRLLYLAVTEERRYATRFPESLPENCVEDGFFATWCALSGLLSDRRIEPAAMSAVRGREITPLSFFSTALDGLLWSGDVKPEHQAFCTAYKMGPANQDEGGAVRDIEDVFGQHNRYRGNDEAGTPDDWASYDKIECLFTRRLDEWRRGTKWLRARIRPGFPE